MLRKSGAISVQMLVLLVPVFFGMMGFAIDLAHLYLMRSELKSAANSAAMAAAAKLIGTEASSDDATQTAKLTYEPDSGFGNKYGFGGMALGTTTGNLTSEVADPTYYAALADALGTSDAGGGEASGSTAKYVRVTIKADAPLLFWNFLSIVQEPKTTIDVQAIAGVSAPVCTACAIEPFAIAAVDSSDTVDFGLVINQRYTFSYSCSGGGGGFGGGSTGAINSYPVINYLLLDRLNPSAQVFADEQDQAYRIGAQGMPGLPGQPWSDTLAYGCIKITAESDAGENVWGTENSSPLSMTCGSAATTVTSLLCGLDVRFENTPPSACTSTNVVDLDTMVSIYSQDTDLTDLDDYTAYTGNGRRLITIPVVDALNTAGGMLVLGFRQFIVQPRTDLTLTALDPSDSGGRFVATYIGSVAPVRSGIVGGCPQQTAGPGKVVLHQ